MQMYFDSYQQHQLLHMLMLLSLNFAAAYTLSYGPSDCPIELQHYQVTAFLRCEMLVNHYSELNGNVIYGLVCRKDQG
jgi:hypothetical protein